MNTLSCPICQREMTGNDPSQWPVFPFCSRRCRLIDLGRWLGESYRIAADTDAEVLSPSNDERDSP